MPMQRINLLPSEERRKASRERGLMYALLFLILVVAVLGVPQPELYLRPESPGELDMANTREKARASSRLGT